MKVENFREELGIGSVFATFDLYVPALKMTIHNMKIIKTKNGKKFPAMPTYCMTDSNGQKNFLPVISFSPEKKTEFMNSLYDLLKPYVNDFQG